MQDMLIRGFAAKIPFLPAPTQRDYLAAQDCPLIYTEGEGQENLENCLKTYRGRPGELWVFGGFRVLGGSRDKIVATVKDLKSRQIVIVDKMYGERSDKHETEMLDRAIKKIAGSSRVRGSGKFAAKIGALGGKAKLESMRNKRMPEEIAGPIWGQELLSVPLRLELMNPRGYFERKWTEASARRRLDHYRKT